MKKTSIMNDEYLTALELSQRLKLHVVTLAVWRKKKRGPKYKKIGRMVRYPIKAILDWESRQGGMK